MTTPNYSLTTTAWPFEFLLPESLSLLGVSLPQRAGFRWLPGEPAPLFVPVIAVTMEQSVNPGCSRRGLGVTGFDVGSSGNDVDFCPCQ